ncbi:MAG: hypothetical protein A2747_01830 [Candidatus Yonathbacteria bacterium RIFCSPHIGHO2_01_FULL_44_41]|uniref:AB hydrolase-1 domain-containing protein n=1 Tax=Candidatus Yonathbacteria bacterium RIFCSPHIGHO2_02_FULL_44_14 TaxID=1802724 RepID=A0A1G2SAC1_9BACT|nr:MAG: hypothetical protein A2747_01830 [Candidatus Yonathbacteria bacterium RIFCSPHIGHO2_01_FULL_44_41]OHA81602.1 MAG: hypothetical protein A3D51_02405 [Candidatus Yonathbacteria bacterium RIFCSPHIGHO2_02_FULL_44_14]OHA81783.1 MAG: hypothetical protein A3B06_02340 [Candidatus Yonathbacteria bacterium RIFCSPLOWO2_01_FULL_43_20]
MKLNILKNKFVYFDLYEKKGSDVLLVIMSGISGGKDSFLVKMGTQFFKKNDFDILRINFCNDDIFNKSDCFKMGDLSVDLYLKSLYQCIQSSNKKYREVVIIGHSFSAVISILFYKKYSKLIKFKKLILWDPSVPSQIVDSIKSNFIFDEAKNVYKTKDTKYKFLISFSRKFLNDLEKYDDIDRILKTLTVDKLYIGAEKGARDNTRYYFDNSTEKKRLKIIKNTGHMFGTSAAKKELFTSTLKFISQQ